MGPGCQRKDGDRRADAPPPTFLKGPSRALWLASIPLMYPTDGQADATSVGRIAWELATAPSPLVCDRL